jgi:hypothetical protein
MLPGHASLMPYFVYEIQSPRRLTLMDTFEEYRQARTHARTLRGTIQPADDKSFRVIFAANSEEAERLLMDVREPRPLGEE